MLDINTMRPQCWRGHVWDGELAEEEGGAKVDGEGVVPFFQWYIYNVWDADAVAGVGDQDVGSDLAVVGGEFFEEAHDVGGTRHIDLVGGDSELW